MKNHPKIQTIDGMVEYTLSHLIRVLLRRFVKKVIK